MSPIRSLKSSRFRDLLRHPLLARGARRRHLGKAHRRTKSGFTGIGSILKQHRSMQALDDALDDGQAEAGSVFGRPAAAKERLEYSIEIACRNARSGVLDLQHGRTALAIDADVDMAATWRKAHRIVDQVAHHGADHDGLPPCHDRLDKREAQIDAPAG